MPWLYKPCSKKDARFHARCRVFERAARHGKPFLTEVVRPGMKCFPQWCVCCGNGLGQTRRRGMAAAGYAQWLARTPGSAEQQSWLAGFLVRIAELIIAQKVPEQMAATEQRPHQAGGRWEREMRLLGFSEAQVTAELARRWRVPDSIVRALETAEDPVPSVPFCRLGGIVQVAMLLAEIGLEEPKSPADTIASLPEEIKRALQLGSAWLAEHLPPVADFVDVSVR